MRDGYLKLVFFEKNCFQNLKVLFTLPRLTINKIETLSILIQHLSLRVNIDSVHSTYIHYSCTRFYRVDIIPEMNLGVCYIPKIPHDHNEMKYIIVFRYHHLRIRKIKLI